MVFMETNNLQWIDSVKSLKDIVSLFNLIELAQDTTKNQLFENGCDDTNGH